MFDLQKIEEMASAIDVEFRFDPDKVEAYYKGDIARFRPEIERIAKKLNADTELTFVCDPPKERYPSFVRSAEGTVTIAKTYISLRFRPKE